MVKCETLRTYGKTLREWKQVESIEWKGQKREIERISQVELRFTEYDMATGAKIRNGSEDLSADRLDNVKSYSVHTWDGKRYNKGGNRWFDYELTVKIDRNSRGALKEIAAMWFPSAVAIEIR